ncbi:hypothetical protein BT69DRAFT_1302168 [Atractiella rhizophila]|nr:hypothetical protein BT69DRAFT_1302168 [Atractiella rhizophila]
MQTNEQSRVIHACQLHKKIHQRNHGTLSLGTDYFVKFGPQERILPEMTTQKYIWSQAMGDPIKPGTPRVPKVLDCFMHERSMIMVVEYINLDASPPDIHQRRAAVLQWLSEVPLPPNHSFGQLNGGHFQHEFFKDGVTPLVFTSVDALERYIEKARTMHWQRGKLVKPVNISAEPCVFMQTVDDLSDFGVDEFGNTVLMNLANVAALPVTFAGHMCSDPALSALVESFGLSNNPNLPSMARISGLLWMTSDRRLGLDNDGFPEPQAPRKPHRRDRLASKSTPTAFDLQRKKFTRSIESRNRVSRQSLL